MNAVILLLVISFLGSQFKILRMSWYTYMKPFLDHLELVMKKYLSSVYDSFPGFDSYSIYQLLSGRSKYNYSYDFSSIFWVLFLYFTQIIIEIAINLYIWLNSIYESNTDSYMKFPNKCCIGCISAYTSSRHLYF